NRQAQVPVDSLSCQTMQPCSCGVAHENTCPVSRSQTAMPELSSSFSPKPMTAPGEQRSDSTLLEFPGASRAVPEWRKQLSQRAREVQEGGARESEEAAAAAQESAAVSCALPSAQLELVPDLEQPVMNPIVSKALERLERARRFDVGVDGVATAATLAPDPE